MTLPVASGHDSIDTLYDWLKRKVRETSYGEIGLTFIIHDHRIVRAKKEEVISCKAANE